MDKKKRTKRVEIALSDDEYKTLLELKTRARLAEWIRETALNQKPRKRPKTIEPALLFELNRIGVNINQLARFCNTQKSSIDLISLLTTLRNIEKNLVKIRENIQC